MIDYETMAEHNFTHGERAAIKLFLSFPELLIESVEEELNDVLEEEDGEDGQSDPGGSEG